MNDKNLFDENEDKKIDEKEKELNSEEKDENKASEQDEEKKQSEEVKERKEELRNKLKEGMSKNKDSKNSKEKDEENKFKQLGGKFNFKGFIMLLFIITLVMSLPSILSDTAKTPSDEVSYTEFIQNIKSGKIKKVDEKEGYVYGYSADEKNVYRARMITDRLGGDPKLVETIEYNGVGIK